MTCDCPDWELNNEILNSFVQVSVIHGLGDYKAHDGKTFVFCPWCGKKLKAEIDDDELDALAGVSLVE